MRAMDTTTTERGGGQNIEENLERCRGKVQDTAVKAMKRKYLTLHLDGKTYRLPAAFVRAMRAELKRQEKNQCPPAR